VDELGTPAAAPDKSLTFVMLFMSGAALVIARKKFIAA